MKVKKRIIFSILPTVFICGFYYKFWYKTLPFPIDFDVSGKGVFKIEALLNRKDNSEFKKIRKDTINIDVDEINKASFNIQSAKRPKRIKFIFTPENSDFKIRISNIELKNGKLKLDNLKHFTVKNALMNVESNYIVLTPPISNFIKITPLNLFIMIL